MPGSSSSEDSEPVLGRMYSHKQQPEVASGAVAAAPAASARATRQRSGVSREPTAEPEEHAEQGSGAAGRKGPSRTASGKRRQSVRAGGQRGKDEEEAGVDRSLPPAPTTDTIPFEPSKIVGKAIQAWFDDEDGEPVGKFFKGKIMEYDPDKGTHSIKFVDGDVVNVDFTSTTSFRAVQWDLSKHKDPYHHEAVVTGPGASWKGGAAAAPAAAAAAGGSAAAAGGPEQQQTQGRGKGGRRSRGQAAASAAEEAGGQAEPGSPRMRGGRGGVRRQPSGHRGKQHAAETEQQGEQPAEPAAAPAAEAPADLAAADHAELAGPAELAEDSDVDIGGIMVQVASTGEQLLAETAAAQTAEAEQAAAGTAAEAQPAAPSKGATAAAAAGQEKQPDQAAEPPAPGQTPGAAVSRGVTPASSGGSRGQQQAGAPRSRPDKQTKKRVASWAQLAVRSAPAGALPAAEQQQQPEQEQAAVPAEQQQQQAALQQEEDVKEEAAAAAAAEPAQMDVQVEAAPAEAASAASAEAQNAAPAEPAAGAAAASEAAAAAAAAAALAEKEGEEEAEEQQAQQEEQRGGRGKRMRGGRQKQAQAQQRLGRRALQQKREGVAEDMADAAAEPAEAAAPAQQAEDAAPPSAGPAPKRQRGAKGATVQAGEETRRPGSAEKGVPGRRRSGKPAAAGAAAAEQARSPAAAEVADAAAAPSSAGKQQRAAPAEVPPHPDPLVQDLLDKRQELLEAEAQYERQLAQAAETAANIRRIMQQMHGVPVDYDQLRTAAASQPDKQPQLTKLVGGYQKWSEKAFVLLQQQHVAAQEASRQTLDPWKALANVGGRRQSLPDGPKPTKPPAAPAAAQTGQKQQTQQAGKQQVQRQQRTGPLAAAASLPEGLLGPFGGGSSQPQQHELGLAVALAPLKRETSAEPAVGAAAQPAQQVQPAPPPQQLGPGEGVKAEDGGAEREKERRLAFEPTGDWRRDGAIQVLTLALNLEHSPLSAAVEMEQQLYEDYLKGQEGDGGNDEEYLHAVRVVFNHLSRESSEHRPLLPFLVLSGVERPQAVVRLSAAELKAAEAKAAQLMQRPAQGGLQGELDTMPLPQAAAAPPPPPQPQPAEAQPKPADSVPPPPPPPPPPLAAAAAEAADTSAAVSAAAQAAAELNSRMQAAQAEQAALPPPAPAVPGAAGTDATAREAAAAVAAAPPAPAQVEQVEQQQLGAAAMDLD